jgi:hypothetical protein
MIGGQQTMPANRKGWCLQTYKQNWKMKLFVEELVTINNNLVTERIIID